MHNYYAQNRVKLKKLMRKYLNFSQNDLEKELKKPFSELFEEMWTVYEKDILENFPYIGGDKVGGTKNLVGGYMFVAMGEVCLKHGMTLEKWGLIATDCYRSFFENYPLFMRKLLGKIYTNPKIMAKMLVKKDLENENNLKENPEGFKTKVQPATDEFPIIFHNLACPLTVFAEKYGYTKYIPYLCNFDYVMFEAFFINFVR
ncbi:MAG: L-2-amino-thiazoline-4-carboxylic acid hydrolase, partial [Clostridia bacterium]